jgi:hypothetical protein
MEPRPHRRDPHAQGRPPPGGAAVSNRTIFASYCYQQMLIQLYREATDDLKRCPDEFVIMIYRECKDLLHDMSDAGCLN